MAQVKGVYEKRDQTEDKEQLIQGSFPATLQTKVINWILDFEFVDMT